MALIMPKINLSQNFMENVRLNPLLIDVHKTFRFINTDLWSEDTTLNTKYERKYKDERVKQ